MYKIKEYKKEFFLILFLIICFILNTIFEYYSYKNFKNENIFETEAKIINIYEKDDYDILRLKSKSFDFFSSINKNEDLNKFDYIKVAIDTRKVEFIDYLKGFYTKIIYFDKVFHDKQEDSYIKIKIIENIKQNHTNSQIVELFNTLFLAIPANKELRTIFVNLSISHIIALSGFHLVVLSIVIYWILYFPYSYFHTKYFPFRNKKFDILIVTITILFYYLILTDIVPSLLRAFVLFCLGVFLLRSNIKIVSYMTLLFTFLIVIAFFPRYLFSIGFWFSTSAVFYIYLFVQYFKNLKKWQILIFFNTWMFLIFNPIVHYFFYQTALEQFYSIFLTIAFTVFYPFEIVAHIFNFAEYFDWILIYIFNFRFEVYDTVTPLWFFVLYVISSFASIYSKKAFYILNIMMIGFNFYIYFLK
ncbi:ComEC/Rec2 family competence protein [Aliarcobacter thereius]|uniref:ComEC/Rec2 family competence protein n=1 Tax=Aliarcobacter thereius TaxID=544718 RepID=UPI0010FD96CA|nr:ComEC/Rec2 family competence protein [Aliarcobacter thereius]TLT06327.1 ComEC/Rec2 family competence protein [Aliarcobacter thereius]